MLIRKYKHRPPRAGRVPQLPYKGHHSNELNSWELKTQRSRSSRCSTASRRRSTGAIGSLDLAGRAMETGQLPPEQIRNGLKDVQADLVDLSHALAVLRANDELSN